MKHYPWYRVDRHLDPAARLALGRVSLELANAAEQPAANHTQSLLTVMAGEVYDYDQQRRALAAAGHEFQSDSHAELLLHGYENGGKNFFRRLHGTFAAAIWDARNRRLVLTNDHFGMKPLYYTKLPGRLLLAFQIKALLADPEVSRKSHLSGIAQFFSYGQLLGEDSLLQAVRVLPPAAWLTYEVDTDRLILNRYWRLEARYESNRPTEREILDRLDEAFKRAVERRVTGRNSLGISLSSGLDSRTILGTIEHSKVPVTSVSLGVKGSIDHRSARHLAALTNRRHYCCLLTTEFLSRFEEHLRWMVHLTDGCYLSQCIVMPTLPLYRQLGIEVLLRGHGGVLMHMDQAYNFSLDPDALAIRDEAALEDWLFHHLRTYMLGAIDGPLLASEHQDALEILARKSLRACLRESADILPPLHRVAPIYHPATPPRGGYVDGEV
jgi:asparagine synthase (glutamine-hydrolysing)